LLGTDTGVAVVLLARLLAAHVEQLARYHRCVQIDLVGHSEGGLNGWYYVQKLDGAVAGAISSRWGLRAAHPGRIRGISALILSSPGGSIGVPIQIERST
jgi:pimeloyl-ACP methyl ester carboxylesterase